MLVLLFSVLVVSLSFSAEPFTNPICANGNDPWVVQHEGFYYYCYSGGGGINIAKSERIENICASQGTRVWTAPAGTMYSEELWAPELHYLKGKWYVYVAADDGENANHRMYVLEGSSQDPQDPFEFKGKLASHSDRWAIDGTVLEAKDGKLYFIWSGWFGFKDVQQDIYIAPMENPWTMETGELTHTIEVESAVLNNAILREAQGASGDSCVGKIDFEDSYLEFTVDITSAGPYLLKAWYGSETNLAISSHEVLVDGEAKDFLYYPPAGWDNWNAATIALELGEGSHTIRIAKGDSYAELDYFELFFKGQDRIRISSPQYSWEVKGSPPSINEGPQILVKNNSVHVIYSASGSWTDDYCLGQLTCINENFMDSASWTKKSESVFLPTDDVFGPGHASFVKSPDLSEDWIVYHAAKSQGSGWDRNVRMQKFSWDENDFPLFGSPVSTGVELDGPSDDVVNIAKPQQSKLDSPQLPKKQHKLYDMKGRDRTQDIKQKAKGLLLMK